MICGRVGGLQVINATDPLEAHYVSSINLIPPAHKMIVAGNYMYAIMAANTLRVFDVQEPERLVALGSYTYDGHLTDDMAFLNNYVYLRNWIDGLMVFDLRDPYAPQLVGHLDQYVEQSLITVANGYAYVADWGRLFVVDVTNPSFPQEVGFLSHDDYPPNQLLSMGHYLYLVGGQNLHIIDVSIPSEPQQIPFEPAWVPNRSLYRMALFGPNSIAVLDENNLVVLDLSDLTDPVQIGALALGNRLGDDVIENIVIAGDYAYAGTRQGNIWVINIADLTNPHLAGQFDGFEQIYEIAIMDDYLYVNAGDAGILVLRVDILTP